MTQYRMWRLDAKPFIEMALRAVRVDPQCEHEVVFETNERGGLLRVQVLAAEDARIIPNYNHTRGDSELTPCPLCAPPNAVCTCGHQKLLHSGRDNIDGCERCDACKQFCVDGKRWHP